ncbi:MAG: TRAP-type C4-dicarboxylate transport system permease small subunit [Psychromonas sp.]|jgi:TRAP-type C4-dicarboxylate transport system permease small subunit|uniref:TRAP transporter small permease n=1 Tax=Psychromonas sp. TaxID=1884585 RepID=UPI0039E2D46D
MNRFIKKLDQILSFFCVSLSCFLVVCVVWQVFSRYVLNAPSTVTNELARFLFIWVGLMGAAYTLGQKRHLAIDLLHMSLDYKPKKQAVIQLFINLTSFFFTSVIMIYGGGKLMLSTLSTGQISPTLGIEMGFVYAAIPLSGIFMTLYLCRDFLDNHVQLIASPHQPADGETL